MFEDMFYPLMNFKHLRGIGEFIFQVCMSQLLLGNKPPQNDAIYLFSGS